MKIYFLCEAYNVAKNNITLNGHYMYSTGSLDGSCSIKIYGSVNYGFVVKAKF